MITDNYVPQKAGQPRGDERGAALVTSILLLGLLGAIAMTVLAVVHTETRIASSDLDRTRTFYAAAASIEKMTTDFSGLFARTSRPTSTQLSTIANSPPTELINEGFSFSNPPQSIAQDSVTLTAMRQAQNITNGSYPRTTISAGPFVGLTASVAPYILNTTATANNGTQVSLTRTMNNFLIPIFQFGMFSNEDMEVHPGPQFTFNGRVHANGNLYLNGNVTFLAKVTTAQEAVRDVLRNGNSHDGTVSFQVGSINVPMTIGSVYLGPNLPGATSGQRGYFPGSPNGTSNSTWKTVSVAAAATGVSNQFGGQLLTRTTGVAPLLLPLQLDGNQTREIIKRRMPNDDVTLSDSRFHSKAEIRILLDDESPSTTDASGIPSTKGVRLSQFNPVPLPLGVTSGKALWKINDSGSYTDTSATCPRQGSSSGPLADTVRGIKGTSATSANGVTIPAGSGVTGKILIEIIDVNGVAYDVTAQILSMGMSEGEPNGIVYLQRPLWAAFTQGSRDASGGNNYLTYILNSTTMGADGEIKIATGIPAQEGTYGYLTSIQDDTAVGTQPVRGNAPGTAGSWNSIVPINIYNVREGRANTSLDANTVYDRGMMSVVEINMRNLARWMDGVYDSNLLQGSNAVSTNIGSPDGYIVYVSDRRGDKVKSERDSTGVTLNTTNGMVDNEDIYGMNNSLDPGEDVIDAGIDLATGQPKKGTLQRDLTELPNPAALSGTSGADFTARASRAKTVAAWLNPTNYFRRSVRLFNGEDLQISGGTNKLSATKGITIASENMIYIWGNYNTTGINCQPTAGSTLNDSLQSCHYSGNQVPASVVVDAFTPLSKTWFDAETSMFPDDLGKRAADQSLPGTTSETSVRAGIIAGNNLSALAGSPDAGNTDESRLCGGMHNFPRFLEDWNNQRWNFVGSLIPLYHSTQALGQYNSNSTIYSPPTRNWAFDATFQDPNKLPPGTPQFQYIEPTAFRQVL